MNAVTENRYEDLLTNSKYYDLGLPSNIYKAVNSKIYPEELCKGNGRFLVKRSIQDFGELPGKIDSFISQIKPNENKKLTILHSYNQVVSDVDLTCDSFKQIGEIKFKDNFNTDVFDSYRIYVHGPIFPQYSHESCLSQNPFISINFQIKYVGKSSNVKIVTLDELIDKIKKNFAKKYPIQEANIATEPQASAPDQSICLLF
jgi:hypothetical protein